jgi:hypothetical protein
MPELEPLADFPASVAQVKSLRDKGIQVVLELPETETEQLAILHGLQKNDHYLRVVIYDADEFNQLVTGKNRK